MQNMKGYNGVSTDDSNVVTEQPQSQSKEKSFYLRLAEQLEPRLCCGSERIFEYTQNSCSTGFSALCCEQFNDKRYPKTNFLLNSLCSTRLCTGAVEFLAGIATGAAEAPVSCCLLCYTALRVKCSENTK